MPDIPCILSQPLEPLQNVYADRWVKVVKIALGISGKIKAVHMEL